MPEQGIAGVVVQPPGDDRQYVLRARIVVDAASYVNPLFGDGILRALLSAKHAATTIALALRRGDCSRAGLARYERRHFIRYRLDALLMDMPRDMSRRPNLLLQVTSLGWVRHALFNALLRA